MTAASRSMRPRCRCARSSPSGARSAARRSSAPKRITGAPLTMKLIDVTEAQALETILRSVAGYMAAPRDTGTGPSRYDRILVMATTHRAATGGTASARDQQPTPRFNGTQRFVPPRQRPAASSPSRTKTDEPDENPPSPPVFTFPPARAERLPNQPGQVVNRAARTARVQPTTAINPSIPLRRKTSRRRRSVSSRPGMMVAPPPQRPAESAGHDPAASRRRANNSNVTPVPYN